MPGAHLRLVVTLTGTRAWRWSRRAIMLAKGRGGMDAGGEQVKLAIDGGLCLRKIVKQATDRRDVLPVVPVRRRVAIAAHNTSPARSL